MKLLWSGGIAFALIAVLPACLAWRHHHAEDFALPYHDHFAESSISEWTAFGGNWQVLDAVLQNNSDDTGTKLVTGSSRLRNYRMEADVQLLNNYGDAGVMLRVQRPEEGTNAFFGYYVGVRLPDLLLLGKMDYGYVLLQQRTIPGGVRPGVWYHLSTTVRDCDLQAQVTSQSGSLLAQAEGNSEDCMRTGRFGLRSFAAGGAWRKVSVEAIR